ncbi:hypothetical protein K7I13_02505 [Brucepastera parasyntrophica]|uniref:hypothetical protein n=1 Tax=Brucepastera parasyntrophica TaxID=2880008 RepID=UPI002109571D|nr:hypothetical protein [Brucepastera parasyntrophica]ULQ60207.1 hypothetical protein K7I13_02505 [Brucepastera parasyntrophica]
MRKNGIKIILFILLCPVLFFGCKTTPDTTEVTEEITVEELYPEEDLLPEASLPDTDDQIIPDDETVPEEDIETDILNETEDESFSIEDAEEPVNPPDGERLLYFYPEPDLFFSEIFPPSSPAETIPDSSEAGNAEMPDSQSGDENQPSVESLPPVIPSEPAETERADIPADENTSPGELPREESVQEQPVSPEVEIQDQEPAPLPSRTVTLAQGQILEVWYPGRSWVFLGDSLAQSGLKYEYRKLDNGDTLFGFRALKPGNYILSFSKFDVLADSYLTDLLAVTVTEGSQSQNGSSVRAPNYSGSAGLHEAPSVSEGGTVPSAGAEQPSSVTEDQTASHLSPVPVVSGISETDRNTDSVMTDEPMLSVISGPAQNAPQSGAPVVTETPSDLLEKARASLSAGDAAAALQYLDTFFSIAVSSLDEGWFLRGQAYEANGPQKDIRKALAAYETLITAYPGSSLWKDADARIRYIQRFYFQIR